MWVGPNTVYSLFLGYSAYTGAKTAFTSNSDGSRPLWTGEIVYLCIPHGPQRIETIGTSVAHVRESQHRLDPVCRLLGQFCSIKPPFNPIGTVPDRCGQLGYPLSVSLMALNGTRPLGRV